MTNFIMKYKVHISDINYGGHMGNDRSLSLFHEARIVFLKSLGYSEMNIGNGIGIIMKDAHVDYLAVVSHSQYHVKRIHDENNGLLPPFLRL